MPQRVVEDASRGVNHLNNALESVPMTVAVDVITNHSGLSYNKLKTAICLSFSTQEAVHHSNVIGTFELGIR